MLLFSYYGSLDGRIVKEFNTVHFLIKRFGSEWRPYNIFKTSYAYNTKAFHNIDYIESIQAWLVKAASESEGSTELARTSTAWSKCVQGICMRLSQGPFDAASYNTHPVCLVFKRLNLEFCVTVEVFSRKYWLIALFKRTQGCSARLNNLAFCFT